MSTFIRGQHQRRSKFGNLHTVRAASVTRDAWDRLPPAERTRIQRQLSRANATGPATARFVAPSRCPVCGGPVFFYQNEYGSRVYFDELSPPWPKHPCTEHAQPRRTKRRQNAVGVAARPRTQVIEIRRQEAGLGGDPDAEFQAAYGSARWPAYEVQERIKTVNGVWLILVRIDGIEQKFQLFLRRPKWPAEVRQGELVFVRGRRLSYVARRSLVPKELPVERAQGPRAFVEKLLLPGEDL